MPAAQAAKEKMTPVFSLAASAAWPSAAENAQTNPPLRPAPSQHRINFAQTNPTPTWLTPNSHPDHQLPTAVLYRGLGSAISNTATGFQAPLYDDRVRPRCTSKERDAETGIDNSLARYFSSPQGRFTSPDPIGNFVADPTNPQSWNLYSYVRNNPFVFIDPLGLCSQTSNGYIDSDTGGKFLFSGPCPSGAIGEQTAGGNSTTATATSPNVPYAFDVEYAGTGTNALFSTTVVATTLQQPSKSTIGNCMLENQDAFSLAALVDSSAAAIGLQTDIGRTFLGNLFLGNDVMGVASIFLNSGTPEGTFATAVNQSATRGLVYGIGQPLRIGGNSPTAVRRLFPRRGRPPQVLARSKNLASGLGLILDVLDAKEVIDVAFTAGLAYACVAH